MKIVCSKCKKTIGCYISCLRHECGRGYCYLAKAYELCGIEDKEEKKEICEECEHANKAK